MECVELFKKIDELNDKYLDILEDICNIESPTALKKGVDKVGNYFTAMAKERGWRVEKCEQEIAGDVICITLNPESNKRPLAVSGHIDTVFPVGTFEYPPVKRDKTKMYGPGVMDCKGGVAAAFFAMEALDLCGYRERPVKLLIQTDEETSCITSSKETIKYICKIAENAEMFLNLEGYVNGKAVLMSKGILRYRFTVHGKGGHSSECFNGANAIAEASNKILRLEEMKDPDGLTCNCGVISGGTAINAVAENCEFYVDIRFSTSEQMEEAKRIVTETAQTSIIKGCTCELEQISQRPAMEYSEKNYKLLDKINEIYKANGLPVLAPMKVLAGTDAAYITQCGIPCVDSLGTEGGCIHSVNEYIEIKSLAESAKRIASAIYCFDSNEKNK